MFAEDDEPDQRTTWKGLHLRHTILRGLIYLTTSTLPSFAPSLFLRSICCVQSNHPEHLAPLGIALSLCLGQSQALAQGQHACARILKARSCLMLSGLNLNNIVCVYVHWRLVCPTRLSTDLRHGASKRVPSCPPHSVLFSDSDGR